MLEPERREAQEHRPRIPELGERDDVAESDGLRLQVALQLCDGREEVSERSWCSGWPPEVALPVFVKTSPGAPDARAEGASIRVN